MSRRALWKYRLCIVRGWNSHQPHCGSIVLSCCLRRNKRKRKSDKKLRKYRGSNESVQWRYSSQKPMQRKTSTWGKTVDGCCWGSVALRFISEQYPQPYKEPSILNVACRVEGNIYTTPVLLHLSATVGRQSMDKEHVVSGQRLDSPFTSHLASFQSSLPPLPRSIVHLFVF